jgi:hypothetical protein
MSVCAVSSIKFVNGPPAGAPTRRGEFNRVGFWVVIKVEQYQTIEVSKYNELKDNDRPRVKRTITGAAVGNRIRIEAKALSGLGNGPLPEYLKRERPQSGKRTSVKCKRFSQPRNKGGHGDHSEGRVAFCGDRPSQRSIPSFFSRLSGEDSQLRVGANRSFACQKNYLYRQRHMKPKLA